MKTYKEYYELGLREHLEWRSHQKEEWWKRGSQDGLEIKGDYIETVKFLTIDEKNDSSLFKNGTNVLNSEWGILFSMLGQALVDWCVENVDWKDLWSFDFRLRRGVENGENVYFPFFEMSITQPEGKYPEIIKEEDEKKLKKFEKCRDALFEIVSTFIESHGKNIPNDWNMFTFGLDCLCESCKYGKWICSSDGYMGLMNYTDGIYEEYVECM